MTTAPACPYLTPPEVAKLLRVRIDKVRGWIRRGELAAVDVSETIGGRPRYRIARDDLDAFLRRRQVTTPPVTVRGRRQPAIKQYV